MFKLDLTEIYIRKEIAKATRDDKVHPKQNTLIDERMRRLDKKENDSHKNRRGGKRKYFTITGTKSTKNIEVEAVMDEEIGQTSTGIFIDKVK